MLPGQAEHGCCFGTPGGFLRRLEEGNWLRHVIEHVALELQNMAGHHVRRGRTRGMRGQHGVYDVIYAWIDAEVARATGRLTVVLVGSLLPGQLRGVERRRSSVATTSTGSRRRRGKQLLHDAGLPVLQGERVRSADAAVKAARRLGFPVVKPLDGNHGRGVNGGFALDQEVARAYDQAKGRRFRRPCRAADARKRPPPAGIGGRIVAAARRKSPATDGARSQG